MRFGGGKPLLFLLVLSLICTAPPLLARKKQKPPDSAANEQRRAVHALNRLSFGPRPGDLQQVLAMGVDKWIDLQLHPERMSDSALEARLAPFRTLRMSPHQMVEEFPDGQMIRQIMNGKRRMPSDAAQRAIVQAQIGRIEEKREQKEERSEEQQKTVQPVRAADTVPPPAMAAQQSGAPSASETAKTAEELAAAAEQSGNSPVEGNSANTMSASNPAPPGEMSPTAASETKSAADDSEARRREDRLYADLAVQRLPDLPPDQRYKKVLSMSADEQLAFADALRGRDRDLFLDGLDPSQKETFLAMNSPETVVVDELVQAKLLRAIYSDRQLEEVMTDFWFNHFNVFIHKGADRVLVTSYEQDVIRPHALGKFEDLLVATAKSPAMLFYLDNWLSVGPNSLQGRGVPRHPLPGGPYRYPPLPSTNPEAKRRQNSGLNENYGRELLELHTLSVNGGYSQRDVTEVAKVFTGWTIDRPYQDGEFNYDPRRHEPGPKFVLGHRIKPKGEAEGLEVLHMLATSPKTAHFISLKLAQRFVSDDPPQALVDRMAKTFLKKKGDIREVLSTLFQSPEFWSDEAYRAKVKTPLEFVASAVRATGADVDDAMPLARQLNNMGEPLYAAQPPTGYSMKAETWVSSSDLLNRMNFALALTAGKIRGAKVDAIQLAGGPPAPADATLALSTMEASLLDDDVSKQTHDSIVAQIAPHAPEPQKPPESQNSISSSDQKVEPDRKAQPKPPVSRPPDAAMIAGLLLGSPEFQRR
ncbi:MAG TPA: DUF1800 domain-containing protein [Verrucomicrobiae bacterium]|nr:DUF1800 domain-containing protein [Verrucomicrobiae bacterium]